MSVIVKPETKLTYPDDGSRLSMRFPQKLWKIVNECESGAIHWGMKGKTILLDYKKFQGQYLNSTASTFKTKNITSFIRQLNLYGFRKVTSHNRDPLCNANNPDIHEFVHEHFQNGRVDLLNHISRKAGSANVKSNYKHQKKDCSRELIERENAPGVKLLKCRAALKEALDKAVLHYIRGDNLENEDPLADIANSNSNDAVSELFGFDFHSIPNAEANMDWINRNLALLSPSCRMAEEFPILLPSRNRGTENWLSTTAPSPKHPVNSSPFSDLDYAVKKEQIYCP